LRSGIVALPSAKKLKRETKNMNLEDELLVYIEEGRRSYRLRRSINTCQDYEPTMKRAWRAGFYSARDGISANAALATLLKDINMEKYD